MSHREFTSSRLDAIAKESRNIPLFIVTINNHDNQLTYLWHLEKLILNRSRYVAKRKETLLELKKILEEGEEERQA